MEEGTWGRGWNESQIVGEEKGNGRLVGAAETSKERTEWRRLQRKNLNILGLISTRSFRSFDNLLFKFNVSLPLVIGELLQKTVAVNSFDPTTAILPAK